MLLDYKYTRKEGGRGLISVEECVRTEEHSLSNYVKQLKNGRMKECSKIFELIRDEKALINEFKPTSKKSGK